MRILILCCLLFSWSSFASITDIWPQLTIDQKVQVIIEYKKVMAEQNDFQIGSNFLDFIMAEAHAAEMNCIYGGWPSSKIRGLCSRPQVMNPAYEHGSCGKQEMHCQPLLFGEGLCVSARTRRERNSSFRNCSANFHKKKRSHLKLIQSLISKGKEKELLALFDHIDKICQSGTQRRTAMCRSLERLVTQLKDKFEGVNAIAQMENTVKVIQGVGIISSLRCLEPLEIAIQPIEIDTPEIPIEKVTLQNEEKKQEQVKPIKIEAPIIREISSLPPVKEEKREELKPIKELPKPDGFYSPTQALSDINSGKLQFLGRGLLNGRDPIHSSGPGIRTCVYKNDRAYVLYRGCMGNKSEAPNIDLTIINFDGEISRFYVETPNTFKGSLSKAAPEAYEVKFALNHYKGDKVPKNMSLEQLNDYHKNQTSMMSTNASCTVAGPFGQENYKGCRNNHPKKEQWLEAASQFRSNPPPEWQQTLQSLRQRVLKSY